MKKNYKKYTVYLDDEKTRQLKSQLILDSRSLSEWIRAHIELELIMKHNQAQSKQ